MIFFGVGVGTFVVVDAAIDTTFVDCCCIGCGGAAAEEGSSRTDSGLTKLNSLLLLSEPRLRDLNAVGEGVAAVVVDDCCSSSLLLFNSCANGFTKLKPLLLLLLLLLLLFVVELLPLLVPPSPPFIDVGEVNEIFRETTFGLESVKLRFSALLPAPVVVVVVDVE